MLIKRTIYLIKTKKNVVLEIYVPNTSHKLDTIYFLDGQNTFLDKNATYKRSLRMKKHFKYLENELNKYALGVAIYNGESEKERNNEYAPFKITYSYIKEMKTNNPNKFRCFISDLKNIIIPYIEENFNVYKDINHRFIYGSSLAATTTLYLAYSKDKLFNTVGCFSTALFLFHDEFYNYLNKRKNSNARIFLYVGKNEISDAIKDKSLYLNTSLELYNYLKDKCNDTKLLISKDGIHNEASWDKVFNYFLSFIYNSDITII